MRRVIFALMVASVAGALYGQGTPTYTPVENPFQGDFAFTLGQPVSLRVDIQGVRLDNLTVTALAEARPGQKLKCEAVLAGDNSTDKKATLTPVLLLEDASGRALEKVSLDPFKVKTGREFQERQKITVEGDSATAARKVYVFIQVGF